MTDELSNMNREAGSRGADSGQGGFVALAVIAAAVGAGAAILFAPEEGVRTRRRVTQGLRNLRGEAAGTISQLQRDLRRRKDQARREKQIVGLAGLLIGAGLTALFTPASGIATRQRLGSTLSRIKVGTVDRIERLRQRQDDSGDAATEPQEVRGVQELGRGPNSVF